MSAPTRSSPLPVPVALPAQWPAIEQLRMQIRNDEALVEIYENWICDHAAGLCATHPEIERIRALAARLTARRAELATLSMPAPTATHEAPAGSLVTIGAPVPASPLQTP